MLSGTNVLAGNLGILPGNGELMSLGWDRRLLAGN
jgi:hypothetical protein